MAKNNVEKKAMVVAGIIEKVFGKRLTLRCIISDKVEESDKIDWPTLVISTATAIVIALSLDTEKGKKLYNLNDLYEIFEEIVRVMRAW